MVSNIIQSQLLPGIIEATAVVPTAQPWIMQMSIGCNEKVAPVDS
jgi:hypothetical protein